MSQSKKEQIQNNTPDTYGMIAGKANNSKKAAKRLIAFMGRQKMRLLVIFLLILISSGLNIFTPLLAGRALDSLNQLVPGPQSPFETVGRAIGEILLVLVCVHLLTAALRYLLEYIKAGVAQNMTLAIRIELNKKLNALPLSYYDSHQKGEILSRITTDVEKIVDIFEQSMVPLLIAAVSLTGSIIIMMGISPLLTLIAFGSVFVSIWATSRITGKAYQIFLKNQETLGTLGAHMQEFYKGRLILKAFSQEQEAVEDIKRAADAQFHASVKAQFITYLVKPVVRIISQLSYMAVAVLGGIALVQGRLTLGLVQAFIQYMNQSAEPLMDASYTINMVQAAFAAAERIFEVLDEAEEPQDCADAKELVNPRGEISFSGVSFGYDPEDLLMSDINLHIAPGQKVAIVGPTGAGKTTFVNLLMRFYEIGQGMITIDKTDISKLSRRNLRSVLGMVLQDPWLFEGTIRENITYGNPSASEDDIERAARLSGADRFIHTLPKGGDTLLNEEISNLSHGQIQLLTIARAILADPAVLILDEATSSVDTRTERDIQKAMQNLMKGRTSFVIAHRLSTIVDSDLILVMEHGAIVQQGTHQELVGQEGLYQTLYLNQFAA